jgi:hypothetical protein
MKCEYCGRFPAVVNLSTARRVIGGGPGPDTWTCTACLYSSPQAQALAQADEDAEGYRATGGRLN